MSCLGLVPAQVAASAFPRRTGECPVGPHGPANAPSESGTRVGWSISGTELWQLADRCATLGCWGAALGVRTGEPLRRTGKGSASPGTRLGAKPDRQWREIARTLACPRPVLTVL